MPKPNLPIDENEIARCLQELGIADVSVLDDEVIALLLQEDEDVRATIKTAPLQSMFKPFGIVSTLLLEGHGLPSVESSRLEESNDNNEGSTTAHNHKAGQSNEINEEEAEDNKKAYLKMFSERTPELMEGEIAKFAQCMENWGAFDEDETAPEAARGSDSIPKAAKQ